MDIVGNRKYVEISGDRTHELPPLLVRVTPEFARLDNMLSLAADLVETEDLVVARPSNEPDPAIDRELARRRFEMALKLVDEYRSILTLWKWGFSVLEWIHQCEITFSSKPELQSLLRPDLWPHAGRSSFVQLLEDKSVPAPNLKNAVGLRLTFRQAPPFSCFSDQFLFLLKGPVFSTAYQTWAAMSPESTSSLPPERFHFEVVDMAL